MAKTHPVKWYSSEMQGAPQHTKQTEGLLIQHLKALLVTGFGSLTPDSIVWDASEGAAKATFGSGHSYLKDSVIECSGASPAEYNGEHMITKVDTTHVWFELDAEPAGDAAGTLEIKYPSLGWSISHESGDGLQAIFVAAGDLGEVSLRVDNTPFSGYVKSYHWTAKVQMVTDVVDINTYELCDTDDNQHWNSCSYNYDRDENWKMFGDNRFFYWFTKAGYTDRYRVYMAGYIDTRKVGDRYHFIIDGGADDSENNGNSSTLKMGYSGNFDRRLARKHHQLEGATTFRPLTLIEVASSSSYGVDTPNPVDNAFLIVDSPVLLMESTEDSLVSVITRGALRGSLPYFREVLTYNKSYDGKVINKNNKVYYCVSGSVDDSTTNTNSYETLVAFDITPVEV